MLTRKTKTKKTQTIKIINATTMRKTLRKTMRKTMGKTMGRMKRRMKRRMRRRRMRRTHIFGWEEEFVSM